MVANCRLVRRSLAHLSSGVIHLSESGQRIPPADGAGTPGPRVSGRLSRLDTASPRWPPGPQRPTPPSGWARPRHSGRLRMAPERRSWRYGCSWQKGLPAPNLALEQNGLTGFGERLCSADHFLHGPTGMVDILKAAVGQIAVEPVAFPQSPGTLPLHLFIS